MKPIKFKEQNVVFAKDQQSNHDPGCIVYPIVMAICVIEVIVTLCLI